MEFRLLSRYLQTVESMDMLNLVSVYEIPDFRIEDKMVVGIRVHPLRRFRMPDDFLTLLEEGSVG